VNRFHRLALALAGALALSALTPLPSSALKAKKRTPDDSVMIVTANVAEAWVPSDLRKHGDMNRFVNRVLDEFKYRPDILALQEVRRSSAGYIARKLSSRSGQRYRVVVVPPSNPYFPYGGGRAGAKETSILINAKTMKVLDDGGYLATVAKRVHEVEPHDPVLHQAFALVKKRNTNMKFATMSTHLLPRNYMVNTKVDKYYRNKWSKQMHNKLRRRYGARRGVNYLIAGDFNQNVCLRSFGGDCRSRSPFWKTLRGFGYRDTAKTFGAVDLIWSKGMSGAIHSIDSGFKSLSASKAYSDHVFRWTVLGPDRYSPRVPKPLTVDVRKSKTGKPIVYLKWGKSDDRAGSGIKRISFERKVNAGAWEAVDPWRPFAHRDTDRTWGEFVRYRVRAVDRAGNSSRYVKRYVDVRR
jgi:hypothetical protein